MINDKIRAQIAAEFKRGKPTREIFEMLKPRTKKLTVQGVAQTVRKLKAETKPVTGTDTYDATPIMAATKTTTTPNFDLLSTIRAIANAPRVTAEARISFIKSLLSDK